MLATQVQYWTLKETERHNLKTEDLGYKTLNETIRHNIVGETETQRHNVAVEDETKRHNLAQESYWSNDLLEKQRHNIVSEEIDTGMLYTKQMDAATNRMNAQTNAFNASTNRFQAVANYNLGLDANRIAQQNADTSERDQNVRFLQWSSADKQTSVQSERADIERQNADTNVMNAETRQQELGVKQQEADTATQNLELQRSRFNWQKFTDMSNIGVKLSDSFMKNFTNILNSLN